MKGLAELRTQDLFFQGALRTVQDYITCFTPRLKDLAASTKQSRRRQPHSDRDYPTLENASVIDSSHGSFCRCCACRTSTFHRANFLCSRHRHYQTRSARPTCNAVLQQLFVDWHSHQVGSTVVSVANMRTDILYIALPQQLLHPRSF